jgi:hypothetical protein
MKKIFLFSLFIVCSLFFISNSYAQGNLQFNQVISYSQLYNTSSGGGVYTFSSPSYVVPENKVWKIEKFCMTKFTADFGYLIVNNAYQLRPDDVNSGPIWLKAGDQISATTSTSGGGNYNGTFFISIIEFNVVP